MAHEVPIERDENEIFPVLPQRTDMDFTERLWLFCQGMVV